MMDFIVFLAVESVGLSYIWPKIMERREGFNNRSLLSDNPHLRQCYRAWRWSVPATFFASGVFVLSQFDSFWLLFEDVMLMNVCILLFAILVGSGISECLGEYFRRHSMPFSRLSPGLKGRHG